MSQMAAGRKKPRKVTKPTRRGEGTAPLKHPAELEVLLAERQKEGDHRRWKEKVGVLSFLGSALVICVACGIVFLSGGYSLTEKQLAAALVVQFFTGLGGFLAGMGLKRGGESWREHEQR